MNDLEKFLAKKFNKRFCCFTGSGTTAIYLILKALDLKNKKVLYPDISCMAPVNAALYAGYEVLFCDVNLEDYTMDLNALKKAIDKYDIGTVVPTHIYGHKCNIKEIKRICKSKGIFVLEDSAQNINLSKYSDASIMSFGHTKILETNNGGGAIFTNDELLYKNFKKQKINLQKKPSNLNELFNNYREKYYSIMKNKSEDSIYKSIFHLQMKSKETFIYDMDYNEELVEEIKKINYIKNERNYRANLYNKYLEEKNIYKSKKDYDVLWRYSFLYKGNREELLKRVREKSIDISSWYPALHKFYSNQPEDEFNNANIIEKEIVNLWVDLQYSENKILDDIKQINSIINEQI